MFNFVFVVAFVSISIGYQIFFVACFSFELYTDDLINRVYNKLAVIMKLTAYYAITDHH